MFLSRQDSQPLLFMQSVLTPDLCFMVLPVLAVAPHYQLVLDEECRAELQLPPVGEPRIGEDILCGVIVCARGDHEPPTVNLLAPVVVSLRDRIGAQIIQTQFGYSHRHALVPPQEVALCS